MFKQTLLDRTLYRIKRLIPAPLFEALAPSYHKALAWGGAILYGFPSRKLKVIGVTGTKGKSTTVYLTAKFLEAGGFKTAAIGSLGFKIGQREWPNTLKMTMPGRMKLQKFLRSALNAGCTHVVMEVTSEGLAQGRHIGVHFDGAVFTNLHREHLEAHGSFEKYRAAKQLLFFMAPSVHVINIDDPESKFFGNVPAKRKIFYGINSGEMRASNVQADENGATFRVYGTEFRTHLGGLFNVSNCLAAMATAAMYGVDLPTIKPALEGIHEIPGRMQFIQHIPFGIVVDYAHTPDSLEAVYKTLRPESGRLICVLGAAGGGRDKWKRKEFGALAERYCDRIYLTNEDPYDENPEHIVEDVAAGITGPGQKKVERIMDRRAAMAAALTEATDGDIVIITGKGSETSIALANGVKLPWSDAQTVKDLLLGK